MKNYVLMCPNICIDCYLFYTYKHSKEVKSEGK